MRTLTEKALNKMAQRYIDSLSHVLYELDGEEKQTGFFKKSAVENIAQAYVFFDENYKGNITNIRVVDKDGDIVDVDTRIYKRTSEKALYVAFKHEFMEV